MTPILEMQRINKSFFGNPANDEVDLDVLPGEIHALLGENGAGKTTLMNILYGIYKADSGEVRWRGAPVHFNSPRDAISCGIGMVHQHFTLVDKLTVSENITLGLKSKGYPFSDRGSVNKMIEEISRLYGLEVNPKAKTQDLSVGEQQRVEIMKLLYRDADLLVLDEPTAVLTPGETKEFFNVLRKLKENGKSSIIITHRIPEVMEIADRVTVLRDGRRILISSIKELDETRLSEAMIGRKLELIERGNAPLSDVKSGLVVEKVRIEERKGLLLDDVSINVGSGEILGIAGVDGNGQKQLAESIMGISKCRSGSISLNGVCLDRLGVSARKRQGIGYISDDRHRDGLIMNMSLCENMLLRSDRSGLIRKGLIFRNGLRQETQKAIEGFAIKTHSSEIPVRLLSGGNQQKLILAREMHEGVKLILAFQPTRGLDIGASRYIRELLLKYRNLGCAVLLISADLEEIFSISDRVAIIHGGRIMGEVRNGIAVNMTDIGLMMAGKEVRAK